MAVVKYVNTSGIVRVVTAEVVWVLSDGDELVLSRGSDGYRGVAVGRRCSGCGTGLRLR